MNNFAELSAVLDAAVTSLVSEYHLASEKLTAEQLASAIQQAIEAGDFVRHVDPLHQQQVVYEPYRQVENLRQRNEALEARVAELEDRIEQVGRASGFAQRLKAAEARADSAQAEAANARETCRMWGPSSGCN